MIHAYNGLNDPNIGTSLHSHGMMFNGTNYYDGAVGITQCSIPMNQTMTYYIDTSLQVKQDHCGLQLLSDRYRRGRTGFTATIWVNMLMVFELVCIYLVRKDSAGTDRFDVALIILPKNATGRNDNVTWDDEYTVVVSDWLVKDPAIVCTS